MDSEKKISTALVATLKASDIGGLAKDYAEIGIDAFLEEGTLKEIPIIGTLITIVRAGMSLSDRIFEKKSFLRSWVRWLIYRKASASA